MRDRHVSFSAMSEDDPKLREGLPEPVVLMNSSMSLKKFEWVRDAQTQEVWFQMTQVNNIGAVSGDIRQKIVRFNPTDTDALTAFLANNPIRKRL